MTVVSRIDWFRVLMDLKRAGLSLEAIAAKVGVSKSAVIGWKNLFAEPKHGDGERLIWLWMAHTDHLRTELPLEGDTPKVGIPTAPAPDTRPT